jgi:hypothetical protein
MATIRVLALPRGLRSAAGAVAALLIIVAAAIDRIGQAQEVRQGAVADAREKDVRELIDRYFTTWSAADIERYGQCFIPQAAIQFIDPQGRLATMPLAMFLESQRAAHREAAGGLKETAESVEIRFEQQLARVIVYWKLVDGSRTEYGYDHFTLMQSGGRWRIANLVFYSTPPPDRGR